MSDEPNISVLIAEFASEDEQARARASAEILRIGLAAVPALVEAGDSDDDFVWRLAVETLAKMRPASPGDDPALLIATLSSPSVHVASAAAYALANFGAEAREPLLAQLNGKPGDLSRAVAFSLSKLASVDPAVTPALINALASKESAARANAALALLFADKPAPEAIPSLIQALREEDPERRTQIAETLQHYGESSVPALLAALRSPEWTERAGSAETLGWIASHYGIDSAGWPAMHSVVAGLSSTLHDPNFAVVLVAAKSLRVIDAPHASPAASVLVEILRAKSGREFEDLVSTMGWIPFPEADALVPLLVVALRHGDEGGRAAAAKTLGHLKVAPSSDAVPVLLGALEDSQSAVSFAAANALARIGPSVSAPAVPVLHAALLSNDSDRQIEAIYLLMYVAPADAAVAVPALIKALGDSELDARAADALGHIGPLASEAVRALIGALTHWDESVRWSAAKALAEIGPPAAEAATVTLFKLLGDPDEEVRLVAEEALRELGSGPAHPN